MNKVIYLTGAPASGKSTAIKYLKENLKNIFIFEYGSEFTERIKKKHKEIDNQKDIRRLSSQLILPSDVEELDNELIKEIKNLRQKFNVLIDSHPVTKESYGFRITPYSFEQIKELNPDYLICLILDSSKTISRINSDAQGRPVISEFEATLHMNLQTSVLIHYGIIIGKPIYFIDSNKSVEEIVKQIISITKIE